MIASSVGSYKRYFIAVEGFTDSTGGADYNMGLSRRRAEAVVLYLSGDKNVDFNFIHEIGLGDMKPVDSNKTRAGRAKNRRVDVQIYSADAALSAATGGQ